MTSTSPAARHALRAAATLRFARSTAWATKRRAAVLAALALVALILAPGAIACHPSSGFGGTLGTVVTDHGPQVATISLGVCKGRVPVTVYFATLPNKPLVVDPLYAQLDIVAPKDVDCLVESCGFGAPAVAFTLRNETAGVDLTGVLVNGHLTIDLSLSGQWRNQPATFVGAFT